MQLSIMIKIYSMSHFKFQPRIVNDDDGGAPVSGAEHADEHVVQPTA